MTWRVRQCDSHNLK